MKNTKNKKMVRECFVSTTVHHENSYLTPFLLQKVRTKKSIAQLCHKTSYHGNNVSASLWSHHRVIVIAFSRHRNRTIAQSSLHYLVIDQLTLTSMARTWTSLPYPNPNPIKMTSKGGFSAFWNNLRYNIISFFIFQ